MADNPRPLHGANALSCAQLVCHGFEDYHARFSALTSRAKGHFEQAQWAAASADALQRIGLYDHCIADTLQQLGSIERLFWSQVRDAYAALIDQWLDAELYKTWFNTLTRRLLTIEEVDASVEFMAMDIEPTDAITHPVARRIYTISESRPADAFARLLGDIAFSTPYAHRLRCAAGIAIRLQDDLAHWGSHPVRSIELLHTVFYRERRAYLVGRVLGEHRFSPCVICLVNGEGGIKVEAVLSRRRDVAHLFGVSRSYFMADLGTVGDAVVFLRSLLVGKPVDEIYTVLGRVKQGKTERYRAFFSHLKQHPAEQLVPAEGTPGMVMAVFTLPSYPLVFKVIRDRFGWQKEMTRQDVIDKYALVFQMDRVGRLLDAQAYRQLRIPAARFSALLLDELLTGCSASVQRDGEDVLIHLCHVQRRFRPLNLYLREQSGQAQREAVLDYAQAIHDLACNNIFPGDMLLKNFGVSRHGRAVFYDYDELCRVTDCRFRAWPAPGDEQEQLADEPWFHVEKGDVFPERFAQFMGLPKELLALVKERHAELFDPHWWQGLQQAFVAGHYPDAPPYPRSLHLA